MANEFKDFGFGTIKNGLGDAWKGLKVGGGVSLLAGVAAGGLAVAAMSIFTMAAPALVGAAVVGGLLGTGFTAVGSLTWGASVGAAWGVITGGKREMNKSARAQQESLDVAQANAEYRLQQAQQKNMNIRHAISHEGQSQADRAAKYQMHNHLAEGKSADHFHSKFAANKATEQGQAQGGMSK
jgi:Oleosin.